jgi:hypothetical protein
VGIEKTEVGRCGGRGVPLPQMCTWASTISTVGMVSRPAEQVKVPDPRLARSHCRWRRFRRCASCRHQGEVMTHTSRATTPQRVLRRTAPGVRVGSRKNQRIPAPSAMSSPTAIPRRILLQIAMSMLETRRARRRHILAPRSCQVDLGRQPMAGSIVRRPTVSNWTTRAWPRERSSLSRLGWSRRSPLRRSGSRGPSYCRRSPRRSSSLISTGCPSGDRAPTLVSDSRVPRIDPARQRRRRVP